MLLGGFDRNGKSFAMEFFDDALRRFQTAVDMMNGIGSTVNAEFPIEDFELGAHGANRTVVKMRHFEITSVKRLIAAHRRQRRFVVHIKLLSRFIVPRECQRIMNGRKEKHELRFMQSGFGL